MAAQNLTNEMSVGSRNPTIPPEFALLAKLQYNVESDTWTPRDLQQSTAVLSKSAVPTTISSAGDHKIPLQTKDDDLLMLDDLPADSTSKSGRFI